MVVDAFSVDVADRVDSRVEGCFWAPRGREVRASSVGDEELVSSRASKLGLRRLLLGSSAKTGLVL